MAGILPPRTCTVAPVRSCPTRGALLSRHLEVGPDSLVTEQSAAEAASARDTLCRTLYARLFTYVVSRINESIKVRILRALPWSKNN